jgi:hypothetical protein
MDQNANLSFLVQRVEHEVAIIPILNAAPLTDMILSFERENRYEPAGGYGGLIPQHFKCGPLDRYFLGDFEENSYFGDLGRIYLLGCNCGEVGCWPLAARVIPGAGSVVWDSFQQPHRPERDYSHFGPFVFNARQYRQAVADLQVEFSARVPDLE